MLTKDDATRKATAVFQHTAARASGLGVDDAAAELLQAARAVNILLTPFVVKGVPVDDDFEGGF